MLWKQKDDPVTSCLNVRKQIDFLKSGGSMVQYDSKKIRNELHAVFSAALEELSAKMHC